LNQSEALRNYLDPFFSTDLSKSYQCPAGQHPKSLGQQLRDKNKNNNKSNKKTLKQEKKKEKNK